MNKYAKFILFAIFVFFVGAIMVEAFNPNLQFPDTVRTCKDVLGAGLLKVFKSSLRILQIAGIIITIIRGMTLLVPPIVSKDADALKKVSKDLILIAGILLLLLIVKPLAIFIGGLADLDVSCIL